MNVNEIDDIKDVLTSMMVSGLVPGSIPLIGQPGKTIWDIKLSWDTQRQHKSLAKSKADDVADEIDKAVSKTKGVKKK